MKSHSNEAQYNAIHHGDGPMMVLAGPGAGKTYVITNRVLNLITEHDVPPEEILTVTFSRAAAMEMKQRFDAMTGAKYGGVRFGTFHSVFFEILKKAYHYEASDIATDALKFRLVSEAVREVDYEVDDTNEFISSVVSEIAKVKGEGIDIDTYYSANCPEEVFRSIFIGYRERLLRLKSLDFEDMIIYTYELLKAREDIRYAWQQRFKYILIDEFQDINRLQYETIRLLAEPENNLFIVGDDDQSIYGFRGSRPDIMLSFNEQFEDAKTVTLSTNYRSSAEILEASARLIKHNSKRFKKQISSDNGAKEPVHLETYSDLASEARGICEKIRHYQEQGVKLTDMAVLFRTNLSMRTIALKMHDEHIAFRMKESMPNMFKSFIAEDIIAYLNMALGDDSRGNFARIMNKPVRYISRKALTDEHVDFRSLRNYYTKKEQYWMLDRLKAFEDDINSLRKMTPMSAIHYIRRQIGYEDYLKERATERGIKPDDWFETLEEIEDSASGMASIPQWLAFVEGYEKELEEMMKKNPKEIPEGVELMTMHGAKGLEFDVVFIPTLNEGVCPYRKATLSPEIEEERRLLYVSMTRARHHLHISQVVRRFNKDARPSRFISEIED